MLSKYLASTEQVLHLGPRRSRRSSSSFPSFSQEPKKHKPQSLGVIFPVPYRAAILAISLPKPLPLYGKKNTAAILAISLPSTATLQLTAVDPPGSSQMGKNPGRNGAVRELRTVPCCNSTLTLPKPLAFLWEKTLGVTERYGSFVPYRAVILP